MNTDEIKDERKKALRAAAEKKLENAFSDLDKDSPERTKDIKILLHELQVHSIELELQNEELLKTQQNLEESRNQFKNLFDFAPVGYLVLNEDAIILNANNTICSLLSVDKKDISRQKNGKKQKKCYFFVLNIK